MGWKVGDTGHTLGGIPYRIIADDAAGPRGNLVALLKVDEGELVVRYPADGAHHVPRTYSLGPAKVRA